jgi:hypothetical protein
VKFAIGFIWPGETAWSSAIPVVRTRLGQKKNPGTMTRGFSMCDVSLYQIL